MTQKAPVGKLWGIVLAGGEGKRVRHFLQCLCGNRGIKQFCALVDSRSMLEHTLARVERLIPRAHPRCSEPRASARGHRATRALAYR